MPEARPVPEHWVTARAASRDREAEAGVQREEKRLAAVCSSPHCKPLSSTPFEMAVVEQQRTQKRICEVQA
jgi:hypothetical protein